MFALKNQKATLKSINTRMEFAGKNAEDGQPANDLGIQISGGNDLLDKLSPHLRGCYYMADPEDKNGKLSGIGAALTKLINPELPIKSHAYDYKGVGYKAAIAHGGNAETAILLDACQANNFKVTLLEGGTVTINFAVQCHLQDGQYDLLKTKLQQEILLTLDPPKPGTEKRGAPDQTTLDGVERAKEAARAKPQPNGSKRQRQPAHA